MCRFLFVLFSPCASLGMLCASMLITLAWLRVELWRDSYVQREMGPFFPGLNPTQFQFSSVLGFFRSAKEFWTFLNLEHRRSTTNYNCSLLPYPQALKKIICFALAPAKGISNTCTPRHAKGKRKRTSSSLAYKKNSRFLEDSKMALNFLKRQPGVDTAVG
jgi:hypothetical protein